MSYRLTWMPDVLEAAGLKVAEVDGWQGRGRAEFGTALGVMCHHTAGPLKGNMPSLGICRDGRDDLPGPLCQLCLGRDGTYYIVAAGRANHAGAGQWQGLTTGNSNFIGIEAENAGTGRDPWPDVQMDAYRRGVAALLKHMGADPVMCCGHKEYALPIGRKDDPTFDMTVFRQQVAAIMAGTAPSPIIVPPADAEGRPILRRGPGTASSEGLVRRLQTGLQLAADGVFGGATEASVREFQRKHGLVPDGIVGPRTWASLAMDGLI